MQQTNAVWAENWSPCSVSTTANKGRQVKRREFIGLVGSATAACPFAASAQQLRKVYRIALVHPSNSIIDMGQNSPIRSYRTFFDELRGLGYVEGQNLIVEQLCRARRRGPYVERALN